MKGVWACIGLHIVHDGESADGYEVTTFIVLQGLVLYVALRRAGCVVCRSKEEVHTNLGGLAVYVKEYHDVHIAFESSSLR